MTDANGALDAIEASLFATLTSRKVQRSLADPAASSHEDLMAGIVCLVVEGGGGFANYLGREGELGVIKAALACFLKVEEDAPMVAIETAELQLLNELLAWAHYPNGPVGMTVMPKEFRVSQQLEHPYGWLVLGVEIEF